MDNTLNNMSSLGFDLPKGNSSIIKVIGVGGGGNNALKHMYERGIYGVDFVICNTDAQTLDNNPVSNKVQLGASITEGLGAGADPEVGEKAAIESIDEIKAMLGQNTKMVFITAGMGGGTGTGAAPVVAKVAKEMGILTVGIVTVPFAFEGKRRLEQAESGLENLRNNVDSLIVINNDKLRQQFGNLGFKQAFSKADEVLTNAAKGMAEVITAPFAINIDFRDAKSVLQNSGTALMSTGIATGEKRAEEAVRKALDSPLLNDNKITGAKNVLLLILSGPEEAYEATMDEIGLINDYVQNEAGGGNKANIIFGVGTDDELGEAIKVLVIATGFAPENQKNTGSMERELLPLDKVVKTPISTVGDTVVKTSTTISTPSSSVTSGKEVFRLTDTDEVNSFNSPMNTLTSIQSQQQEEVDTLVEEEPKSGLNIFEEETEQVSISFGQEQEAPQEEKVEYDLFSYNDLEPVSYTFDFSQESKKEEKLPSQIEEEPIVFSVKEKEVVSQEEIIPAPEYRVEEKEEEKVEEFVAFSEPIEETPVSFEIEQKEEFTIVEKRTEESAKVLERRNKLKEFNSRYSVSEEESNLFETIPAFRRRNIAIDLENASEQRITSFVSEENGKIKLRENKFLNKDVD